MNDDNFIDQALKEHARLEAKDDQAFLDQLEEALDENQQQKMMKRKTKLRKRKSPVDCCFSVSQWGGTRHRLD